MSEKDFEASVARALEREAAFAPTPERLLASVRTGSRRRARRQRAIAVSAATLVATVGVVVSLGIGRWPPTAPAPAGPLSAAALELCVGYEGDRLSTSRLTGQLGGERIEAEAEASKGGFPAPLYEGRVGSAQVRIDVVQGGLDGRPMAKSRSVVVDGRDGRIGYPLDGTAGRLLYLESGVRDSLLRVAVDGSAADEARLLDWARRITTEASPTCSH